MSSYPYLRQICLQDVLLAAVGLSNDILILLLPFLHLLAQEGFLFMQLVARTRIPAVPLFLEYGQ